MKKALASFGWILLLLPLISVAGTKTVLHNLKTASIESETRSVSNFIGISSSGSYNVYVKMGSAESLRMEGDSDDINGIETKVENGILKIQDKNRNKRWGFDSKVDIYITAKSLKSLALSGSGKIEVSGTINSDKLSTSLSGSGDIRLNTSTQTFTAAVSGSGDMKVSGSAKRSSISVSGSGDFDGRGLKTDITDIKVSGSADASVSASKTLNAVVSGSGDINYSGNPQVNQKTSGSGSISRH